jgi:hypothetical protein
MRSRTAHILALRLSALLFPGILQGAMHGVLATLGFTHAVRVLGVSRGVFFAAVVPAVSVLIGIPALTRRQALSSGLASAW